MTRRLTLRPVCSWAGRRTAVTRLQIPHPGMWRLCSFKRDIQTPRGQSLTNALVRSATHLCSRHTKLMPTPAVRRVPEEQCWEGLDVFSVSLEQELDRATCTTRVKKKYTLHFGGEPAILDWCGKHHRVIPGDRRVKQEWEEQVS